MERETRFELATFALARQRSTTEPFPHKCFALFSLRATPFEASAQLREILPKVLKRINWILQLKKQSNNDNDNDDDNGNDTTPLAS